MGRSRGNFHSADEDPTQRSRRKKNAASGENLESSSAGQGTSDGKKALYHCNYCNKDITGKIRIKCAMCPDFDLCIECFSVGAEVVPHKSNHPYRVMDNLSFPLFCADWNADDEILLLEGIEMYGLGNWTEVAEHVGTKSKEMCIEHYSNVYMKSPYFPLPDMSHVVGKNRKELLAMAKGHGEDRKGSSMIGEHAMKEESRFSPSRVKVEEIHKVGSSGRLLSTLNSDVESVGRPNSTNPASSAAVKKASNMARIKDGSSVVKVEDPQVDRGYKGKKPNSSVNEGPSLIESSGYNAKRLEFDPEYDNDAEQLLAEMEFKDADTEDERELKLRVLRIYAKRLDERKRRKDFVLERKLLFPNPIEKDLTLEERTIYQRYNSVMRFHSREEHEDLLQIIISEHRTFRKIQELKVKDLRIAFQEHKEARATGCRTPVEADRYIDQKRRREAEDNSRRPKESSQVGPSCQGGPNALESIGKDSNSRPAGLDMSSYVNDFYITGFYETHLLSEAEKRLCCEIRLPPPLYLKMQEVLTKEIFGGGITKKSDAHPLFKIEASKVDRVYDMLVKKGVAQP